LNSIKKFYSAHFYNIVCLECSGRVVMASGWEFEGLGFKPWRLQATFDPRLPKKTKKNSQPYSVPLMIYFARCTLKKNFKKYFRFKGSEKSTNVKNPESLKWLECFAAKWQKNLKFLQPSKGYINKKLNLLKMTCLLSRFHFYGSEGTSIFFSCSLLIKEL